MPGYTHSYTQKRNGRLVFVKGYNNGDGTFNAVANDHQVAALPGTFQNPALVQSARFTKLLVPGAKYPPGSRVPELPAVFWFRHALHYDPSKFWTGVRDHFVHLSAKGGWEAAVEDAVNHILLVVSNNKGRPISEIAARPDVQQALRVAGSASGTAVKKEIRAAWKKGGGDPQSTYLKHLLSDADKNSKTFANRMIAALKEADASKVQSILHRDAVRAGAGEAVAEVRSNAEANLKKWAAAGVKYVKWHAHLDAQTCQSCRNLHGDIVKIGTEFDVSKLVGIVAWHDLTTPPTHPNCRCELRPTDRAGKEIKI